VNLLIRTAAAAALLAPAWAEKKPVTLEAVAETKAPAIVTPVWSPDGGRFLYEEGKKLRVYDCAAKSSKVIATQAELEGKAKSPNKPAGAFDWQNRRVEAEKAQWTPDGKQVLTAAGGDLFLIDAATGAVRQLTATPEKEADPQMSPDGELVGFRLENDLYVMGVKEGKRRRLTADGSGTLWNGRLDWVYPEELSITRAWWWSPDGKDIAYLQFDVSPEMIHPQVDPGPVQAVMEPQRFPKAGTANANVRLGVIGARGGKTRWMDVGPTADRLIARVQWMPGGKEIAVQRLSRIQDDLELLAFDAGSGKGRQLLRERDPAWINIHNILHFFPDGRFLWASERDGFRHLYLMEKDAPRQITIGGWEVTDLHAVDEAAGLAWITTTAESPLERHLYSVNLKTGEVKKQTREPGTHLIAMAPNGAYYLDAWQSTSVPMHQTLHDRAGRELDKVWETPGDRLEYSLLPVETLTFQGKDTTKFYAQMIKPPGFDPAKRYPAIVMVYGGPHAQTVKNKWSGVSWEQALAQRGYVVWWMDNRGMNYRGHAFESAVHRQFGKVELADQLEGVAYLKGLGFVDEKRIGIYGWSFGGYMTLYSMTHAGTTFAAGVAGAPVTDWRHYDTIYTERYMGLPSRNEEGYKASSPVHAAANLQGKLMLVHNFQDDNVLFQNTQNMMDALQRAGKPFETMFYSLKSHGVTGVHKLHMLRTITGFFDRALQP